ncbi:MAG: hypothetical protein RLZZ399_1980 [Verrucomicrobiota bacterium]|jgi:hypothetical protein
MKALAKKRGVYGPVVIGGPPPNERNVAFLNAMGLHLPAEGAGTGPGFGDEGESTGLTVQSGDDGDLATVHPFVGEEIAQVMPERGAIGGLARVGRHLGGFVDHDPVV